MAPDPALLRLQPDLAGVGEVAALLLLTVDDTRSGELGQGRGVGAISMVGAIRTAEKWVAPDPEAPDPEKWVAPDPAPT